MKLVLLVVSLMATIVTGAYAQEVSSEEPEVLADGKDAIHKRVENMHKTRFIEIFLAAHEAKTGDMVAACFNSMFSTVGIPELKNTAPQELVEGLDFVQMKQDFGVLGASLNGPKLWLPDWTDIDIGVERDFNGIKTAWVAQLNMGDNTNVTENTPYEPMTIARKSKLGWTKGTTVILLDDPDGNTWVMKGFQLGLNPKYTYEEFKAAGESNFKKLPKGWKFRIKTLDKDLIETPEGGLATIMPDEFFNIYDKTGPGMTNYQP